MAATVLDHLCARTASSALGGVRVVTGTLDLRYPRPVPLDAGPYDLRAEHDVARGRSVRVRGAILGIDGRPMVEARALFVAVDPFGSGRLHELSHQIEPDRSDGQ